MTASLHVVSAGPGMSLQDQGRPGFLANGLSRGGAMDQLALAEGAALLGVAPEQALTIEMIAVGGRFRAEGGDLLVALSGAPMAARINGHKLHWPGSHILPEGSELSIGGAERGLYGYLSVFGMQAEPILGARSAHFAAGIGETIQSGTVFPCTAQSAGGGTILPGEDRFSGGTIRVLPSVQIDSFDADTIDRFRNSVFTKTKDSSRMGARLSANGQGFSASEGRSILSETIIPGDIQIVGAGDPYVLLGECQTSGGYPRIATVISADLAKVAQAAPGTELRFRFVPLETALAARAQMQKAIKRLSKDVQPATREPSQIADLLSYQLVGGVISAHDGWQED